MHRILGSGGRYLVLRRPSKLPECCLLDDVSVWQTLWGDKEESMYLAGTLRLRFVQFDYLNILEMFDRVFDVGTCHTLGNPL